MTLNAISFELSNGVTRAVQQSWPRKPGMFKGVMLKALDQYLSQRILDGTGGW